MALLDAITEFNKERDRMLHNSQNKSKSIELPPRILKTLITLLKNPPMEQSNIGVGTVVTEKEEDRERNLVDQGGLSEINSMLEKIYLEANSLIMTKNEDITTKSSIKVGDTDMILAKHVLMEGVSKGHASVEESGTKLLTAQITKMINHYLQNVSLVNERVEMINTSYLYGYEQKFSKLLAKLSKVIVAVPKVLMMDKKEDLQISESILLRILNVSNNALRNLNGRLLGKVAHRANLSEPDKSSSIRHKLKKKNPKWEEFVQINHFVQMFYKLEENLSDLKIFLKTHKKEQGHELVEYLVNQSIKVVTQLEQIPWLIGKNSFIDFKLEALRDFAGPLSDTEFIQQRPST
ncbi:uncharacterized protein LOC119974644 isoform X2 [Scyliorhinus canicula]|nr:uncharacterized protein LOC119974644 isoform X2 [Scyliorhinus canicula]XP_038669639.1 uncharacterized protein LOC119974644 isoform X2 [Scyliorhinus canicula]XP_038669640.1 uncharacterized protein LOC119974644 isoform X2 [Scyliorhinus canicula]XP_038669641.1 uncharacterized protein LOC119974644 isoform X2 [Scyliorhinus canicula]